MRHYTKITYWENKRRIELLQEFREAIISYFNNSQYDWRAKSRKENDAAKIARKQINLMKDKANYIIFLSDTNMFNKYLPSPATGGHVVDVDLLSNIFNLDPYGMSHKTVIDRIEIVIGIYTYDSKRSFYRTINPFFWLGLLLEWLVEFPFSLLGKAGFDSKKIEDSLIGKLVKALLSVIGVIAMIIAVLEGFLSILERLGYLDSFNSSLKSLIESLR